MKAVSVKQPWASLVAAGTATIIVQRFTTDYRGPMLVCAGTTVDALGATCGLPEVAPRGVTLAVVELVNVRALRGTDHRRSRRRITKLGGLYAWEIRVLFRVEPLLCRGKAGLFETELPIREVG